MATRKPTEEELHHALKLAEAMRDQDKDKYGLGAVMLNLYERNKLLEDVRMKAEYYVRFGMEDKELTNLRLALAEVRKLDELPDDDSSLFSSED